MEIGVEMTDSYQKQHDLTDELIKCRSTTAFIQIICAISTSQKSCKKRSQRLQINT